jgi:hypothetical protein
LTDIAAEPTKRPTRARDAPLPRADRLDREPADPARPAGQPQPERLGHGEHPLPIGRARQHAIDEVRRGVRHSPRGARRADPAPLARERHDELVVARLAAHAREPVRENAAPQVFGELPLHVAR